MDKIDGFYKGNFFWWWRVSRQKLLVGRRGVTIAVGEALLVQASM